MLKNDVATLCQQKIAAFSRREEPYLLERLKRMPQEKLADHPDLWDFMYSFTGANSYPDLYEAKLGTPNPLPEEEILFFVLSLYANHPQNASLPIGSTLFHRDAPEQIGILLREITAIRRFDTAKIYWYQIINYLKSNKIPVNYPQLTADLIDLYTGTKQDRRRVFASWQRPQYKAGTESAAE